MVYNSQAISITKTTFIKYEPFYETMHKSSFSLLIRGGGVYFNTADSLLQVLFYFNNSSVKKNRIFAYSQFHKTLPITSSQIHWISVRFYEMGDSLRERVLKCKFFNIITRELKISAAQFPQQRCESEPAVLKEIPPPPC